MLSHTFNSNCWDGIVQTQLLFLRTILIKILGKDMIIQLKLEKISHINFASGYGRD